MELFDGVEVAGDQPDHQEGAEHREEPERELDLGEAEPQRRRRLRTGHALHEHAGAGGEGTESDGEDQHHRRRQRHPARVDHGQHRRAAFERELRFEGVLQFEAHAETHRALEGQGTEHVRPGGAVVGRDAQVELHHGRAQVHRDRVQAGEPAPVEEGHQAPGGVARCPAPFGQALHVHLDDLVGLQPPLQLHHPWRRRVARRHRHVLAPRRSTPDARQHPQRDQKVPGHAGWRCHGAFNRRR